MLSEFSAGLVRRDFLAGGSSAIMSSFFRFGPVRARVVLVAGAGASFGASNDESIFNTVR